MTTYIHITYIIFILILLSKFILFDIIIYIHRSIISYLYLNVDIVYIIFRVRFHEGVTPRERNVNFSKIKSFKILKHLPIIHHFSQSPSLPNVESPGSYDYYKDVYGITSGSFFLNVCIHARV